MDRCWSCSLVALVLLVAGCSQSASNGPMPSDPAGLAAHDFLDAVLKGDTERASRRLTPVALERITASGKQFAPPGLETASFRIGEVRHPTANQAIVQCILTDEQPGATARTEEIGCLLRLVENEWRVSGIAYIPGPNRPPMILSFENPQQSTVSSQPPMARTPDTADAATRPSPRTAQQVEPAAAYR